MDKNEYLKVVKKLTPKENKKDNYLKSFLCGGLIGFSGEVIKLFLVNICNMSNDNAISVVLLIVIFLACLLTAMGIFDNLVAKYKSGLIIPISGFAHSITSSSLDYKHDGLITGIGSNFFKLAGSVLLYGIVSAFIFAFLKVVINV